MRPYHGTSYSEAYFHIKECQKNRTSIQIDSSCFRLEMRDDAIFGGWNCCDIFRYNKDGSCTLLVPEGENYWKYAQSIKARLTLYTPLSGRWAVQTDRCRPYVRDRTYRIPPKVWKCKTCGGYQWLGEEAESILYELAPADSHMKWQHANPCRRCNGLGKADYAKQGWVPYQYGMVILPDGTVDRKSIGSSERR